MFHGNQLSFASFALILAGWFWTGALMVSGMSTRYAGSWWVDGAAFCCYIFPPVALLYGVAGLRFDAHKLLAVAAIVASAISFAAIFFVHP